MADERKIIGYLFGKPIYESEGIGADVGNLYMTPLTEEVAKKAAEQMAANAIARRLVAESLVDASPTEGM
jgi:hypothetical protein